MRLLAVLAVVLVVVVVVVVERRRERRLGAAAAAFFAALRTAASGICTMVSLSRRSEPPLNESLLRCGVTDGLALRLRVRFGRSAVVEAALATLVASGARDGDATCAAVAPWLVLATLGVDTNSFFIASSVL